MKNCNNIQEKLIDYIDKNLSNEEVALVENHLKGCENCAKELTEMQQIFGVIRSDVTETPSKNIKLNFDKFLSEEKEKLITKTKVVQLEPKQDWQQYLRIVASIAVVVSAFLLGKYQPNTNSKMASEPTQKQKEVLAMFDNQSASKRIHAIDLSNEVALPNNIIIEALIDRLFNDENTNVRLASAEALAKFSSAGIVRNALIKALETDKEPSLQVELIQILAKIKEKEALEPMKNLLNQEETPNFVKQELQYSIASLL